MPTLRRQTERRFTYDPRLHRYRDTHTGRIVPWKQAATELYSALDNYKAEARGLAKALREGTIDVPTWEREMRTLIKDTHSTSTILAKGGRNHMAQSDWGRVGQRVRSEYAFLANRAREVESGRQALDGTLDRRAEMYVEAGGKTFHRALRLEAEIRGYDEERNRLDAQADHCQPKDRPGCVQVTEWGWVDLGTLPLIGDRQCISGCRCTVEFRNSQTKEVLR